MLEGFEFTTLDATAFEDWSTLASFRSFQESYSTMFVDIDGILVETSNQYFAPRWGTTPGLKDNIEFFRKLYYEGRSHIILITSRTEAFRIVTEKQLERYGIKYHSIIFGLPHNCRRYLINDFSSINPYPGSVALNLPTNAQIMPDLMHHKRYHWGLN